MGILTKRMDNTVSVCLAQSLLVHVCNMCPRPTGSRLSDVPCPHWMRKENIHKEHARVSKEENSIHATQIMCSGSHAPRRNMARRALSLVWLVAQTQR